MHAPSDKTVGVLCMLGAAFVFSLMSLLVKTAGRTMPAMEMVLARGLVTLVLSFLWVKASGVPMWGVNRPLLVLRGLFGFGGLACFYFALTRLPLAEVTTIHFINPILTSILAALILRERVGWPLVLAIASSLAGVLLITRPSFMFGEHTSALDSVGVIAALGGATCSASAYVSVRKLALTDHPLVIVFFFPLVSVPATIPLVWHRLVMPHGVEWWLLLGIGVTTQIAQVFLTWGLAKVSAGRATTVGYSQIVFAALWGAIFFDALPSAWSVFGALLVVGGALVIALTRDTSASPLPEPAPDTAE